MTKPLLLTQPKENKDHTSIACLAKPLWPCCGYLTQLSIILFQYAELESNISQFNARQLGICNSCFGLQLHANKCPVDNGNVALSEIKETFDSNNIRSVGEKLAILTSC